MRLALRTLRTRAIDRALGRMGPHGLPLMGAGDWNDGMNMVGHAGHGESVWVGWFLHVNLERMAELAAARGEGRRAERYRGEARRLHNALEQHAWDGAWYLRAFYDDGTPLGAAQSDECRIDSLTQSWAVISGAGDPERARQAMAAVDEHLIDRQAGLIKLFAPPFDRTAHDPGYIKGYVPGVRENGGQYTHAAIWVIWAYALLGDGARAGALLELINPIRHARVRPRRVQGRAILNRRRCVCRAAAHRARRLDLVYRFGRLALPSGYRNDSRAAPQRKHPDDRAMYSTRLAGL